MSNNRQSMKVYTKEEVRKAIELARDTHPEGRGYMQREEYDYSMDEVFDLLTPIELPSEEEIEEETLEETALSFLPHSEVEHDTDFIIGFEFGAKWMRNKIQGGNNDEQ